MRETGYTRCSLRELAKLPRKDAKRIVAKVDQYARAPQELANNVTEMVGENGKRLRVGNYRVLFDEDDETVTVMWVRKRGEAYRD